MLDMWYRVALRKPGTFEQRIVEVEAGTESSACREVLNALVDPRSWTVESVEPAYGQKPVRRHRVSWIVTIGLVVMVAFLLLLVKVLL